MKSLGEILDGIREAHERERLVYDPDDQVFVYFDTREEAE